MLGVRNQIIGALVAGLIGFLTQILALWLRQRSRRREWNDRLVRLCERLRVTDSETVDEQAGVRTFLAVQPLLEDHLSRAPYEPPEQVLNAYEEIFEYREHYGTRNHVPNATESHILSISDLAGEIVDSVESDRFWRRWGRRVRTLW